MNFIKIVAKSLTFIIIMIFSYLLISIFSMFLTPKHNSLTKGEKIYIYKDIAHTELIIPTKFFYKKYKNIFPDLFHNNYLGYMAFSFGDREFMLNVPTWNDINFKIALKALFINTPALIRVGHYYQIDKNVCHKIVVTKQQLNMLDENILNSIVNKNNKPLKYITDKQSNYISYFQAKSSYNLFFTCNSWTAKMLRTSNLSAPLIAPFSFEVIYPYYNK